MMKMKFALAALAATTTYATPAFAGDTNGFGVGTSAVTGVFDPRYGGIESNGAAYRMGQDSSFNYTRIGDTPPVSFEGCSTLAPGALCVASQGGTNSAGYDETASNSFASLKFAFVNEVTPRDALATSYADLATGKLGAVATTDYFETAQAVSEFRDTLTFNIGNANTSTVTNITVSFLLDGTLNYGPSGSSLDNQFSFGSASGRIQYYGSDVANSESRTAGGWVSYDFGTPSTAFTRFTGVYALTGSSETLAIRDFLNAYTSFGSVLYGNTSAVSFVLPSNVTFTSASGVFLTANQVAAVPEPATWGMMLLGFGIVGSAMRRRVATRDYAVA